MIVIEHNLDVIQSADYVIDLGPEAGAHGGAIVAEGTPEELAKNAGSQTGIFLREKLAIRQPQSSARVAELPKIFAKPAISVHGARHHNLKNLSLRLPHEKIIVINGPEWVWKVELGLRYSFRRGSTPLSG